MWLGYYLAPPTQSLDSLYKALSATERPRSSLVLRQFRAIRTMRKTRLVILPGVRSITQIGCLLLFLSCPSIAFKGQEKRDVEPICKVHELKYWWLPFDTGEGDNLTITQWIGYQCQSYDMAMKGKDNGTDSIHNSCEERIISHGHVVIIGQNGNVNYKTDFGRNHLTAGSVNLNRSSESSNVPGHLTTVRNAFIQKLYKTHIRHQVIFEERGTFNKYEPKSSGRQPSFSSDRNELNPGKSALDKNKLQRNSREGSQDVVSGMRRSNPVLRRTDTFHKTSSSLRINSKLTEANQHFGTLRKRNDQIQRKPLGETNLPIIANKQRMTLPFNRKNDPRKYPFGTFIRIDMNIREKREIDGREEISSNERRRTYYEKEDSIRRAISQQDRRQRTEGPRKLERIGDLHRSTCPAFHDSECLARSVILAETRSQKIPEYSLVNTIDSFREISSDRSHNKKENRENIPKTTLQRQSLLERRETTRRLVMDAKYLKGQSSKDSRYRRDNEKSLLEKRSTLYLDTRIISRDGRMARSNHQHSKRNEKDSTRRISSEVSREYRSEDRENILPLQRLQRQNSRGSQERRERTTPSTLEIIWPKEQYRMDRKLERAETMENESRVSYRRSTRSLEPSASSLVGRTTDFNNQRDTRITGKDNARRIRSEISREYRNGDNASPTQNTLQRQVSPARLEYRETTQEKTTNSQLTNQKEQSRMNRQLKQSASADIRIRLADRRISTRSLESHIISIDSKRFPARILESRGLSRNKREIDPELRRTTRMHEDDNIRIFEPDTSRAFRDEIRKNIPSILRHTSQVGLEGKEIRRSATAIIEPKHFRMYRSIERASSIKNEKGISDRKSKRSLDSNNAISLNRRMTESNLRIDMRINKMHSTGRIKLETSRQSRNEDYGNIYSPENTSRRQVLASRQESIGSSTFTNTLRTHFNGLSQSDRRLERATHNRNEKGLSEKKSTSLQDLSANSLKRKITQYSLRRDTERNEKDSTRRIRSEISREYRNKDRENIPPLQRLRRQNSPGSQERRERSTLPTIAIIQPNDFNEQHKMGRRLERNAPIKNERRLSYTRSTRSLESYDTSIVRRIADSNHQRDTRITEKDSDRRIRSDISREYRNEDRDYIPLRQRLRRQNSPDSQERRERSTLSTIAIIQPNDFNEQHRMGRRLERNAPIKNERRLSYMRSTRSLESYAASLVSSITDFNNQRDTRITGKDNVRRIRSEILREYRNSDNFFPLHNTLRRQVFPGRLEHREIFDRSTTTSIQPTNFKEESRMNRRLEHTAFVSAQQVADRRISKRSLGSHISFVDGSRLLTIRSAQSLKSRVLFFDNRVTESDLRRTRMHEDDNIRRIGKDNLRSAVSREVRNEIRENTAEVQNRLKQQRSLVRRETNIRSDIKINNPQESIKQSRMQRRFESGVFGDNENQLSERRSVRRVETHSHSPDKRFNHWQGMRTVSENDNKRRIRLEVLRDSRNEIRDNRMLRRQERAVTRDDDQRLSDRTLVHSGESRKLPLDIKMAEYNLRREIRTHEKEIARRIRSENSRESREKININPPSARNNLRRQSSPRRQRRTQITERFVISHNDLSSRMDRRVERSESIINERHFSNRGSRLPRVLSLDRRGLEYDLNRVIRAHDRAISRELTSSFHSKLLRQSSTQRRENNPRSPVTILRRMEIEENSRVDMRLEQVASIDNAKRLFGSRISMRSLGSHSIPLDKIIESNLRSRSRINENDASIQTLFPRRLKLERGAEAPLMSIRRNFGKMRMQRKEESFLDNGTYRLYDTRKTTALVEKQNSRSNFSRVRREIRDVSYNLASGLNQRRTSNILRQMEDNRTQPRLIGGIPKLGERHITYSLRILSGEKTDNLQQSHSEERQRKVEVMLSTMKIRRDTIYNKQFVQSSWRRVTSPGIYTFHSELRTNAKQIIHSTVSSEQSQNYDGFQTLRAEKSGSFLSSWVGKIICDIKKAVTGSDSEGNIPNHPVDSGLVRNNKDLPRLTEELQNLKLRPDYEIMRNDNGHLLQDFLLGSVIAGYFISSINLKIRDYRNSICIF